MQRRARTSRFAAIDDRKSILSWRSRTLATAAGLACCALAGSFLPLSTAGAGDPTREVRRQLPVLRLTGPNDGEPINHCVRLRLETTFAEDGALFIFVNGRYFTRTLLRTRPGAETGLYQMDLDVNLKVAEDVLGIKALTPDSGPVSIGVHLHRAAGGDFVAYAEWAGWIGKPWMEILQRESNDGVEAGGRLDGVGPQGNAGFTLPRPVVAIHTLGKDIFYLLLASERVEDLSPAAGPRDAGMLRRVLVLATGPCGGASGSSTQVVGLDSLQAAGWARAHLVLWTYSPEMGWRRSELTTVAWK